MRLKDYQIYIPKYNSDLGYWRDASDIYERNQPGYIPRYGDWKCILCQNDNFRWRKLCYNPNCGAPKDLILKKVEKNVVAPKEKDDHEEVENVPDVSPEPVEKDVPDVSSELVKESPPIKEDVELEPVKESPPIASRSLEEWLILIDETYKLNRNSNIFMHFICLCGELIKIRRRRGWAKDESLGDDNDCKQHIKCLKENIANELNGTEKHKIAIYKFLEVFHETIYKRCYGKELTKKEVEIEKGYLHLLND